MTENVKEDDPESIELIRAELRLTGSMILDLADCNDYLHRLKLGQNLSPFEQALYRRVVG